MSRDKQIAYKISKESVDKIFPKRDIDILGYESPIQTIIGQMRTEYENGIYKAIQEQGVIVDKDELIKALQYDRNQYDKGYINGYNRMASEVAREIFEDIKRTLDTAIWSSDLEIKTNRAVGFNSDAEKFAVRRKAFEDAKDYLQIVEKKYTESEKDNG